MWSRLGAATVVAIAITGCSTDSEDPASSTRTVVDSAGVEVITLSLDPMPVCQLSDVTVRIGSIEGEGGTGLTQVQDVAVLHDGRIGVLDYQEAAVLLFEENGTPSGRIGRRGDGPGELDRVWFLDVLPDGQVLVGDYLPFAWHAYTPDGGHIRSVTMSPRVIGRPDFAFPLGATPEFVVQDVSGSNRNPNGGFTDETRHVIRYASTGEAIDSLGQFYFRRAGFTDPEIGMVEEALFAARGSVFPAGDLLGYASGRSPEIRLLGPGGAPRRIIRWTDEDREVHSDAVASAREDMRRRVEEFLPADRVDASMERFDAREVAERFPAHGRVASGVDGGIWIEEFARPGTGDPPAWFVLEPTGHPRCSIAMPPELTPMHMSRTRVLGVELDEIQVPYVVGYDVQPPSGA